MMKKFLPALLCLFHLTGCIRLLPDQPETPLKRVDLMTLSNIDKTDVKDNAGHHIAIKIFTPAAPNTLNSLRVAMTRFDQNLKFMDYLADVEWKDNLLLLVQQHFMEVLTATNHFKSVSLDTERFRADYGLNTYIHKFEIDQKNNDIQAIINMTVTLSDITSNKITAQKTFDVREKVVNNTTVGYLVALDQAFLKIQTELVHWLASNSILCPLTEPVLKGNQVKLTGLI